MSETTIGIRRFREGATLPTRGTVYAAGYDLYAWVIGRNNRDPLSSEPFGFIYDVEGDEREIIIEPGTMVPIKTGINMRIPEGYEVQIRPRSGLAFKNQITIQNTPGTIDADYDGDGEKFESVIMLRNEGKGAFSVKHGDRIAQMVVNEIPKTTLWEVFGDNKNRLGSNRDGGLGSTGVTK